MIKSPNARGSIGICPKTGDVIEKSTFYSDSAQSLHDMISKNDLKCGKDCDYDPCPIVEQHNSLY